MKAYWQHEDYNLDDYGYLAHAYILLDEKYIVDCRGVVNESLIFEEYIENQDLSYPIEEVNHSIYHHVNEGMFTNFREEEKEQIMDFIEKNIFIYDASYFE